MRCDFATDDDATLKRSFVAEGDEQHEKAYGNDPIGLAGLVVASCAAPMDRQEAPESEADAKPLVATAAAETRVAELRGRFTVDSVAADGARGRIAALGVSAAKHFVASPGGLGRTHMRASFGDAGVGQRPVTVDLPRHANDFTVVEDATSERHVRFALRGAKASSPATIGDGYVVYPGALDGADVVHAVTPAGTEDYVAFDAPPAREELTYDVDVSSVAGLRRIGNVLEFMDAEGTPVLRMMPPYAVGADGTRRDAELDVQGCAVDTSTALPWGRTPVAPGADRASSACDGPA